MKWVKRDDECEEESRDQGLNDKNLLEYFPIRLLFTRFWIVSSSSGKHERKARKFTSKNILITQDKKWLKIIISINVTRNSIEQRVFTLQPTRQTLILSIKNLPKLKNHDVIQELEASLDIENDLRVVNILEHLQSLLSIVLDQWQDLAVLTFETSTHSILALITKYKHSIRKKHRSQRLDLRENSNRLKRQRLTSHQSNHLTFSIFSPVINSPELDDLLLFVSLKVKTYQQ